jgi:hypothetical protein
MPEPWMELPPPPPSEDGDRARRLAQSARAALLRDLGPDDEVAPEAAIEALVEQDSAETPAPHPGYVVGMDVLDEGVAVTILVPWPNVTIGPGNGEG